MNFNEYQKQAAKTAIYPRKVDDFSLAYLALKLVGEANELRSAVVGGYSSNDDLVKEAGDVCWYAGMIARENDLNVNIPHIFPERNFEAAIQGLAVYPAQIAEMVGKAYRDNDGRLNENMQNTIEARLKWILESVLCVLRNTCPGVSFESMLQTNLDKLADRAARNVIGGSGDHR